VDALITDPPYPEIKRAFGKMTVDEWRAMMMAVCKETRNERLGPVTRPNTKQQKIAFFGRPVSFPVAW